MLRGAHAVSQEALTDMGTAHLGCPQVPHFLEPSVLCPALWPLLRVSVYNPCLLSSPSHFVSLSLASFSMSSSVSCSFPPETCICICPGCPAAWILLQPWLSFLLPQSSQLLTHLWHPHPTSLMLSLGERVCGCNQK